MLPKMPPNWFRSPQGSREDTGVASGVADYRQRPGEHGQRSRESDGRTAAAIVSTGIVQWGLGPVVVYWLNGSVT